MVAFIKNKNSANYFFVKKNTNLLSYLQKNNYTYEENFNFLNNIFHQKKIHSKFFYLFGTTWFFKYQGWYIICASFYHPLRQPPRELDNYECVFEFLEFKKTIFESF